MNHPLFLPVFGVTAVVLVAMFYLKRPLYSLGQLGIRTCGGLLGLALLSPLGMGVGVNVANALVIGLLGPSGFGLLVLTQMLL